MVKSTSQALPVVEFEKLIIKVYVSADRTTESIRNTVQYTRTSIRA